MNQNLKGIIIDPGHGGIDSGAIGNNILEKEFNLLISNYMYERFKELGVPVYLTRDNDITINPQERTSKIKSFSGNNPNVILLSNHLNAGGGEGAEVIYSLRNNSILANSILNNITNNGLKKRRVYQRRLPTNPNKDYYYILRDTNDIESLIIEYGFIDSEKDVALLKDNYKDIAEGVIKAVLEYKNIPYTAPEKELTDTYIVKSGDTLYSISKKLNTTVDELKKLNNITNNKLSINQELKIPTKYVDYGETEVYIIKPGDTLYSIANKYNIPLEDLKKLNNNISDTLSIGQIINVPSGLSEVNTYTVSNGDTLYSIAKKFNISINKLKEVNNLTSNMLSIGQELIIPIQKEMTHIVKPGDTLYSISKEYNIPISTIKEINNLSNNNLSIGQILIVSE